MFISPSPPTAQARYDLLGRQISWCFLISFEARVLVRVSSLRTSRAVYDVLRYVGMKPQ
jgi:hypothetical protein